MKLIHNKNIFEFTFLTFINFISFQKIGVIGVYSISIAAVILTLVATVVTTTEEPGKEVVEPFGKFWRKSKYKLLYMSRLVGKQTMWFPNRSDTNRSVQSQKQARSLKFGI